MELHPGHESDEEYLDDPIILIDVEQARFRDNLISSNVGVEDVSCNLNNPDSVTHWKREGVSYYKQKQTFILPVTFFDNSNNIQLLKECRPLSIKVIDCVELPLYKKYVSEIQTSEHEVVSSDISIDVGSIYDNVGKNTATKECILSKLLSETVNIATVSVMSTNKAEVVINRKMLENQSTPIKKGDSRKRHVNLKFQETLKRKHEEEKNTAMRQKNLDYVDFKRNRGLVGLKVINRSILFDDIQEENIEDYKKNKSKAMPVIQKENKRTAEDYIKIVDKVLKRAGTEVIPLSEEDPFVIEDLRSKSNNNPLPQVVIPHIKQSDQSENTLNHYCDPTTSTSRNSLSNKHKNNQSPSILNKELSSTNTVFPKIDKNISKNWTTLNLENKLDQIQKKKHKSSIKKKSKHTKSSSKSTQKQVTKRKNNLRDEETRNKCDESKFKSKDDCNVNKESRSNMNSLYSPIIPCYSVMNSKQLHKPNIVEPINTKPQVFENKVVVSEINGIIKAERLQDQGNSTVLRNLFKKKHTTCSNDTTQTNLQAVSTSVHKDNTQLTLDIHNNAENVMKQTPQSANNNLNSDSRVSFEVENRTSEIEKRDYSPCNKQKNEQLNLNCINNKSNSNTYLNMTKSTNSSISVPQQTNNLLDNNRCGNPIEIFVSRRHPKKAYNVNDCCSEPLHNQTKEYPYNKSFHETSPVLQSKNLIYCTPMNTKNVAPTTNANVHPRGAYGHHNRNMFWSVLYPEFYPQWSSSRVKVDNNLSLTRPHRIQTEAIEKCNSHLKYNNRVSKEDLMPVAIQSTFNEAIRRDGDLKKAPFDCECTFTGNPKRQWYGYSDNKSYQPKTSPKCGPLSKKIKYELAIPNNLKKDNKAATYSKNTSLTKGYSPPILPIPTYQNTLEFLAKQVALDHQISSSEPGQNKRTNKDSPSNGKNNIKRKDLENGQAYNKSHDKLENERDYDKRDNKSVKKISLEDYKKRIASHENNCIDLTDDTKDVEVVRKVSKEADKCFNLRLSTDTLDLGYDSDSTVIL